MTAGRENQKVAVVDTVTMSASCHSTHPSDRSRTGSAVRDREPDGPAVLSGERQPDLDHLLEWFRIRQ